VKRHCRSANGDVLGSGSSSDKNDAAHKLLEPDDEHRRETRADASTKVFDPRGEDEMAFDVDDESTENEECYKITVKKVRKLRNAAGLELNEEEIEYRLAEPGFPTERRPRDSRRDMLTMLSPDEEEELDQFLQKYPGIIGSQAKTDKQKNATRLLIATWKDLFKDNIRDMPSTDLIEHHIPTYEYARLVTTRVGLYTPAEKEY